MKKKGVWKSILKSYDSPQRIAAGVGVGVALGIIPGTGPVASVFIATFLRVNRLAALAGSLATNTWLSLVTFIFAAKIGSWVLRIDWRIAQNDWKEFFRGFSWPQFFEISFLKILAPVLIGYVIISVGFGIIAYFLAFLLISSLRSLPCFEKTLDK
ncbi:MAG: DUF2062 domain-containing protein [Candidatus Omnitrophica bacterium]|nr:DUF2062 domain-containing protein [Candidatus Omnitrophota bacterium]